ncbi:helitron_like_N domain-containing protein [Trichonephila clavipes]|nr:helitron_like_N domain-containing protein [Trichonephila clavipes]
MGDKGVQVNKHSEYVQGVERNTVLHDHNILVHVFKRVTGRVPSDNYKVMIHHDRAPRGEHERRFNAPTTNEIAAVVVSSERITSQDIVIQAYDGRLIRVPEAHSFYDALAYPIIFWKEQEGYICDIPLIHPVTKKTIPTKKCHEKTFMLII